MPSPHDATLDHYRSAPMGNGASHRENKHDRFVRLATGRVQRALSAMELIGRLSSSSYEYSEREAHQIVAALKEQLIDVSRRLAHEKPQKKAFSFDE